MDRDRDLLESELRGNYTDSFIFLNLTLLFFLSLSLSLQALVRPQDAIQDYTQAIKFLQGPGGENADPVELPASL
jgi:hypothetical protein